MNVPAVRMSLGDHLARGASGDVKHEYVDGAAYAMAGGTVEHGAIARTDEVLSESDADWDRGGKFAHYRRLASLREYVVIAQDERAVEHDVRGEGGLWTLRDDSKVGAPG